MKRRRGPSSVLAAVVPLLDGHRLELVDIGSRGGLHPRWRPLSPVLRVTGFEPDAEECRRLNAVAAPNERHLPFALGARAERRPFFLCRAPGCSSLYRPNATFVDQFHFGPEMAVVGETVLDVVPLDDVTAREGLRADHLKIDAQGAALDILAGAPTTLAGTLAVELEVEFNPQYAGQPLFADVDQRMRAGGFALLALRRTSWRRRSPLDGVADVAGGQVVHGDALYYNERRLGATTDHLTLLKWLIILHAYRQHDFIAYVLGGAHAALARLDDGARRALAHALARDAGGIRETARAVTRIGRTSARELLRAVFPPRATAWHDPDF